MGRERRARAIALLCGALVGVGAVVGLRESSPEAPRKTSPTIAWSEIDLGAWSASLPGTPSIGEKTTEALDGPLVMRSYTASRPRGHELSVVAISLNARVCESSTKLEEMAQTTIDGIERDGVPGASWVSKNRETILHGHVARELSISARTLGGEPYTTHVLLIEDRCRVIVASGTTSGWDQTSEDVDRLLASLRPTQS